MYEFIQHGFNEIYQIQKKLGTVLPKGYGQQVIITNLKPNIMKLNSTNAIKAPGAKLLKKTKTVENIYPLVVLVFSMITVSTVLQLVFLA